MMRVSLFCCGFPHFRFRNRKCSPFIHNARTRRHRPCELSKPVAVLSSAAATLQHWWVMFMNVLAKDELVQRSRRATLVIRSPCPTCTILSTCIRLADGHVLCDLLQGAAKTAPLDNGGAVYTRALRSALGCATLYVFESKLKQVFESNLKRDGGRQITPGTRRKRCCI